MCSQGVDQLGLPQDRVRNLPEGGDDLIDQVLAFECMGATGGTLKAYRSVLTRFLSFSGKLSGWNREDVLAYFASQLTGEHRSSAGYLRLQHTVLLALWRHSGINPPITRRDLPPVRRDDLHRPVATTEEIKRLIKYARTLEDHGLRSLVIASTIWGLRRVELTRYEIKGPRLTVIAAKTGTLRQHIIPPELVPMLTGPPDGFDNQEATHVFHKLRAGAKIRVQQQQGWHWIRRALSTHLMQAGVPMPVVSNYMGWAPPSSISAAWYFSPDPGEVDGQVYASHPFLRLWL